MGDHHHVSTRNIHLFKDLQEQFGEAGQEEPAPRRDIVGERHHQVLAEMTEIVEHQWRAGARRGLIKGFLLSGPPGTGKTTLARRLAYELSLRRRRRSEPASIALVMIDGAEVARSRYGESEERIRDIFAHARAGFTMPDQRSVLLFDDIESIFMARGASQAKEWHFSQDSVFFHGVDDLDTSRSTLVLTTNRPDLVDEAIRDRFLTYHVGYPDRETLISIGANLAALQQFPPRERGRLEERMRQAITAGTVRSMRDAHRFVVQQYISDVLGRPSLAETTSDPMA